MPDWRTALLPALTLLLAARPAAAHSLHVEVRLRGDIVKVEAFFSDNTPARDALVSVRDPSGREVASGRTSDQGDWSFPRPPAGRYEVVADAGAGHRTSDAITIPGDVAPNSPNPTTDEVVVTSGPSREELTRFPWLRVAIGLSAIGGLALLLWLVKRSRSQRAVAH